MWTMLPLIVEPFCVTWLETITSIWLGRDDGGAELLPGLVVNVDPQVKAVVSVAVPAAEQIAEPVAGRRVH
jgi:hypothetical protein